MPVYEYACEKCGHEFEAEQRITEAPIKTCPRCRARRVKRLISQTSFVLKGGGWYADLYASKSGKDAAKSEGSAEKTSAAGDGAPAAAAADKAAGETPPKPSGDGASGDGAKGGGAKGAGKRGKRKASKAAA